jgi:hypothetical protein
MRIQRSHMPLDSSPAHLSGIWGARGATYWVICWLFYAPYKIFRHYISANQIRWPPNFVYVLSTHIRCPQKHPLVQNEVVRIEARRLPPPLAGSREGGPRDRIRIATAVSTAEFPPSLAPPCSAQAVGGSLCTCLTCHVSSANAILCHIHDMAGLATDLVQGFRTGRALHWEFLRLRTGFELSSSWSALPCYGADLNRNILDFMR